MPITGLKCNLLFLLLFFYSSFRSFFQSVCVLGYCLAPVAGALIVCKVLLIAEQTKFIFFLRLVSTLVGFLWASYGKDSPAANFNFLQIKLIWIFYDFIFSCICVPRWQSTAQSKTTCCLPNSFLLLHSVMACNITFQHLKEIHTKQKQINIISMCYYNLVKQKKKQARNFFKINVNYVK